MRKGVRERGGERRREKGKKEKKEGDKNSPLSLSLLPRGPEMATVVGSFKGPPGGPLDSPSPPSLLLPLFHSSAPLSSLFSPPSLLFLHLPPPPPASAFCREGEEKLFSPSHPEVFFPLLLKPGDWPHGRSQRTDERRLTINSDYFKTQSASFSPLFPVLLPCLPQGSREFSFLSLLNGWRLLLKLLLPLPASLLGSRLLQGKVCSVPRPPSSVLFIPPPPTKGGSAAQGFYVHHLGKRMEESCSTTCY